jgi:hypothetical protein
MGRASGDNIAAEFHHRCRLWDSRAGCDEARNCCGKARRLQRVWLKENAALLTESHRTKLQNSSIGAAFKAFSA